ncbi:COX assembly mitochondrial protein 2 like [Dissostichus eleginoides]|uniref:COX assembly mitochondrial protein 2 like n=1 Tax=Dissostichus eleginoides TaxID=100907 RepID=A0AAD9CRQ4_DISEL|nr:COX assembly mitochondrial protein 2 like [Dissostichus eleginoides]
MLCPDGVSNTASDRGSKHFSRYQKGKFPKGRGGCSSCIYDMRKCFIKEWGGMRGVVALRTSHTLAF